MKTEDQIKAAVLWIEKLATAKEDGVKQGRLSLGSQEDGFCCLGYGCSVTGVAFYPRAPSSSAFQIKAGLITVQGRSSGDALSCHVMNDGLSFSFLKIAKKLQTVPAHYFLPEVAKGIKEHFAGASA